MITHLLLMNFQSHKRSDFEFHPGVNVIVGETDAGKSAIIRGLRLLKDNRPSGDSFRSWWCDKDDLTVVKLWRGENRSVSRELVKGENRYVIHSQIFKAIGTSVPEEIQKFLNMSEINLQRQLDSSFLLSDTPGNVATYFNKVAKLDKIDTGTANINSWIREITSTIGQPAVKDKPATGLIKQIADKEEELLKYEHLDQFEAKVSALEEMEVCYDKLWKSRARLSAVVMDYGMIEKDIERESAVLEIEDDLNDILADMNSKFFLNEKLTKLSNLISSINQIEEKIQQKEDLIKLEKPVNDILQLMSDRNLAKERITKLSTILSYIDSTNERIKKGESYIALKQAEFEKEMPDICPLCGKNQQTPNMTR